MSTELQEVWNTQLRPERCKTPTLLHQLKQTDLLAYGYSPEDSADHIELRGRDDGRVRLLKRISTAPAGIMLKTLVSECIKGQRIGQCERFDGSDSDYQFVYRFIDDLAQHEPQLIETTQTAGSTMVTPTHCLLDLISEGIAQTASANDQFMYDREFARSYLSRSNSIDDWGREMLEDSLHRYLKRIENYRLLFDVHFSGRRSGSSTKRMTKGYKTRFNSSGRISKAFARFNAALEYAYEHHENAVLCTLTSDPGTYADANRPNPRSLMELIENINPAFNNLLSFMDSDPSTIPDARLESTPGYPAATGRPRYRPPYVKALEFTERGLPHLHVLFFDVPTRESDGMPYLIDKQELSDKWQDYGQGQIVDLYPLTFRDDLNSLGNFGEGVTEGFVDWYRYGDHDYGETWIENRARSHELIEFGNIDEDAETLQQKTAGAYLGKYLSATFGAMLDASESFVSDEPEAYSDKTATWKLGLYWATNRRFWSISKDIEQGIKKHDHIRDSQVRDTVRWATTDSLAQLAKPTVLEDLARRKWDDLDDLQGTLDDLLGNVVTPNVESTLPESSDFLVHIDYLGCYAYWDMPLTDATAPPLDLVEDHVVSSKTPEPPTLGDRPPPTVDVWG